MQDENGFNIKIGLVGNWAVGKTSLLIRYYDNDFLDFLTPSYIDSPIKKVMLDRTFVDINFCEINENIDHGYILNHLYPNTTLFVICFSVVDRISFDYAKTYYVEKIKNFGHFLPFVLVGTQIDKRNNEEVDDPITTEEGKKVSEEIKALWYFECSSKTGENVGDAFQMITHIAFEKVYSDMSATVHQKSKCCVV